MTSAPEQSVIFKILYRKKRKDRLMFFKETREIQSCGLEIN